MCSGSENTHCILTPDSFLILRGACCLIWHQNICVVIPEELHYTWYKDTPSNFVRPELKPYIFVSKDSRLYFSQVSTDPMTFRIASWSIWKRTYSVESVAWCPLKFIKDFQRDFFAGMFFFFSKENEYRLVFCVIQLSLRCPWKLGVSFRWPQTTMVRITAWHKSLASRGPRVWRVCQLNWRWKREVSETFQTHCFILLLLCFLFGRG